MQPLWLDAPDQLNWPPFYSRSFPPTLSHALSHCEPRGLTHSEASCSLIVISEFGFLSIEVTLTLVFREISPFLHPTLFQWNKSQLIWLLYSASEKSNLPIDAEWPHHLNGLLCCLPFLYRILTRLLEVSDDPQVIAVAAHDIGEYVRHYPRGKRYGMFLRKPINIKAYIYYLHPVVIASSHLKRNICLSEHIDWSAHTKLPISPQSTKEMREIVRWSWSLGCSSLSSS